MIWQLRYTADTLSGTRHVIPLPLSPLVIALVTQNGSANHIMPVLSITSASVPALVPFPQLSPLVRSY